MTASVYLEVITMITYSWLLTPSAGKIAYPRLVVVAHGHGTIYFPSV